MNMNRLVYICMVWGGGVMFIVSQDRLVPSPLIPPSPPAEECANRGGCISHTSMAVSLPPSTRGSWMTPPTAGTPGGGGHTRGAIPLTLMSGGNIVTSL